MNDNGTAKPAASFWIVAVLGLLWNSFGAYLYTMAKLDPATTLASAPPAMQDYVANMPLWGHLGWSVGIWASFLGSVLMLLRSRHAVTAFLASGIGAVVSYAAQGMAGVLEAAQPVVILVVIVFLWWFSKNEAAKGTLR
jgi:uncharacterized membrane protein YczE